MCSSPVGRRKVGRPATSGRPRFHGLVVGSVQPGESVGPCPVVQPGWFPRTRAPADPRPVAGRHSSPADALRCSAGSRAASPSVVQDSAIPRVNYLVDRTRAQPPHSHPPVRADGGEQGGSPRGSRVARTAPAQRPARRTARPDAAKEVELRLVAGPRSCGGAAAGRRVSEVLDLAADLSERRGRERGTASRRDRAPGGDRTGCIPPSALPPRKGDERQVCRPPVLLVRVLATGGRRCLVSAILITAPDGDTTCGGGQRRRTSPEARRAELSPEEGGKCSAESQRKLNDPGKALCERHFPRAFSSPDRTRTCDTRINSPLLYQLSYRGMFTSPKN
jgi:hypothetical protein